MQRAKDSEKLHCETKKPIIITSYVVALYIFLTVKQKLESQMQSLLNNLSKCFICSIWQVYYI